MANSIQKKLQLILEYMDKGYHSGVDKANKKTEALKKSIAAVAKAALATVVAITGLTYALMKFIQKGAEVRSVTDTWEGFLKSARMAPDTLDRVREAVNRTVSNMDMMRASVQALATGLAPGELIEFWEMAKQMGDVMSRDVLEVFEGLTRGYNKMEAESLETIGINIRMTDVMNEYMKVTGKTAKEITSLDRKMAMGMAIRKEYADKFASVGDVTTIVREKFQRLVAGLKNLRDRFYEIVATSPKVEGFLDMLTSKLGLTNEELGKNDEQIMRTVDRMVTLIERSITLGEWLYKNKELVASLGAGFIVLSKTGNPVVALFTAIATSAVLCFKTISHAAIDLGILVYTKLIEWHSKWLSALADAVEKVPWLGKEIAEGFRNAIQKGMDISDWIIEQGERNKELLDKYAPPNLLLNWIKGGEQGPKMPGEITGPAFASLVEAYEKAGIGEEKVNILMKDLELIGDYENQKIELYQSTAYRKIEIAQWSAGLEADIREWEIAKMREGLGMRADAYRAGYWAMSRYSAAFYNDSARRGRTLNAMLIAGFGEMVAAYIDAKSAQAKIDFMEASYQLLRALAMGNFYAAGLWAQCAAGAGAMAGAATIAAGVVRSWGQQKAEGLMAEQEAAWEAGTSGGEAMEGQRRQATGIVNTRPIAINVYSTANFNAGYMIFGDSEEAANDLYDDIIADRIEGDIEMGMIAV